MARRFSFTGIGTYNPDLGFTPGVSVRTDPAKRRWIGWAMLASGFLLVNFHRISTGVLSAELVAAFDTTAAELGLLHASFFYIYAALQLPAGVVVDWLGTRRLAAGGIAVVSVGVGAFATSDSYLLAFLSRALMGLGGSVIYISTLRFCANWFRRTEFATMVGVSGTVAIFGELLASTPLALAIAAFGWRGSLLGVGLLGALLAVGIFLLSHTSPEDAGLPPIDGTPPTPDQDLADLLSSTRTILREPETWALGLFLFFTLGEVFTVFGLWGIPYLVHLYGLSVEAASVYILVATVGGMLGGPAMGLLSDRLDRRLELMMAGTLVFAAGMGLIAIVGTPPLLVVGVLFFVVRVLVGVIALSYAVIKERHPAASGTGIGTINSLGFFGGAVFPAVMGAALDAFWTGEVVDGARVYSALGYRVAFGIVAAGGLVAVGLAGWLYLRERAAEASETPAHAPE